MNRACTILALLITVLGAHPARGKTEYQELAKELNTKSPTDLEEIINRAKSDPEKLKSLLVSLDFFIARQVHCLWIATDPDPNKAGLENLKDTALGNLDEILVFPKTTPAEANHDTKKNAIVIDKNLFDDVEQPFAQAVENLVLTRLSEIGGKPDPLHAHLKKLWGGCKTELADFGDAASESYPTRLFPSKIINIYSVGEVSTKLWYQLAMPNWILKDSKRKLLGAHHRNAELREWLGSGPAADLDQENDSKLDDEKDSGIAVPENGSITDGYLKVTISVANHKSDRYSGEEKLLVLRGWIDWNANKHWTAEEQLKWLEVDAKSFSVEERNPYCLFVDPSEWDKKTMTATVSFKAKDHFRSGGWARFRLYYTAKGAESLKCGVRYTDPLEPSGPWQHGGEVEDYKVNKVGDLVAIFDPAGDFFRHDAGTLAVGSPAADLRYADVDVESGSEWDRHLTMTAEMYEPIPEAPEALFASWHFIVDLDGLQSTGHPGGERPVGVFPDLGVDLWADLIWDGHGFLPFLFVGPDRIERLTPLPGLLEARLSDDRRRVDLRLRVKLLEWTLSDLYGEPFPVDEERIRWVAVTNWVDDPSDFEDPPSDFFPDALYLPEGSCERAAREGTALCLDHGRFKVEVDWQDYQGQTGSGQVVPFGSDDSGLMWFFDSENWEMLVKVLDGCDINDRYWVFAAATTDVEYTLRVTDSETGDVREYFNPLGNAAAAITDTDAFATCSAGKTSSLGPAAWMQGFGSGTTSAPHEPAGSGPADVIEKQGACVAGPVSLCLDQGRFLVQVEWLDFQGQTGPGRAVPGGSDDSGLFWFFHDENWEMLVKVLDGCAINGRYWVYAAATTDVEYTLKVTDTRTGSVKRYTNPLGRAADAITDTDAFATCG